MSRNAKIIRGVIGVVVVGSLLIVVNNWWHDYKRAKPANASVATSTVTATSTAPPAAVQSVLVLIDGLNFRSKPDATGTSLRGLRKGEKLIVVGKTGTWLHLQDTNGAVGWVVYNPQYLRLSKTK